MQLLLEVSLRGTIAAAARSLGLTASAVSQQLSVLEREAGVPLLDRSPRGVALTGAGQVLAAHAASVTELLAAARADLDVIGGSTTGLVSMASIASAAATFVSEAALELSASGSGIEFSVTAAEPTAALSRLLAGDVDLAIVDEYDYVPIALPELLVAEELLVEPLVLVSRQGTLPSRSPRRLADLHDARWVMPPIDAACGIAVRSACRAAGFEPKVFWETDDLFLLMHSVAEGHGVAVLPRLTIAADARVDVRPLGEPPLGRRILAVARSSVRTRPVIASALQALAQAAGRHASRKRKGTAHTGADPRPGRPNAR
jgi:DNA-binding transcriptional LysR family regulator